MQILLDQGDVSKDGNFDVDVIKIIDDPLANTTTGAPTTTTAAPTTSPTDKPSGSGKTYFFPIHLFVCALSVLLF